MSKKRSRVSPKSLVMLGIGIVIASVLVGIYSTGQDPTGTIDTIFSLPKKARSYAGGGNFSAGEEEIDMVEFEYKRMRALERVSKITEEGVIQRINEPQRKLYINDPVWTVMQKDRHEHVARVVADYLAVVNNDPTGMVTVHSFRNGQRVAEINSVGNFLTF